MARIMVVDDDPDVRELLDRALARAGYEVTTVADGEAALLAAWQEPPDAVIVDRILPRVAGTDVCRALRARPHLATVPIIMVSARPEGTGVPGGPGRVDGYLEKPLSIPGVLSTLRRLLDHAPGAVW
jgi:DNA-binding response OmpR family regulator